MSTPENFDQTKSPLRSGTSTHEVRGQQIKDLEHRTNIALLIAFILFFAFFIVLFFFYAGGFLGGFLGGISGGILGIIIVVYSIKFIVVLFLVWLFSSLIFLFFVRLVCLRPIFGGAVAVVFSVSLSLLLLTRYETAAESLGFLAISLESALLLIAILHMPLPWLFAWLETPRAAGKTK